MTTADQSNIQREKHRLRQHVRRLRRELSDKDARSRVVMERVAGLEAFLRARCVLFYVDMREEVRTRSLLAATLATDKQVAVPYCSGGRLKAVYLKAISELHPGAYGILEPHEELRADPDRNVHPHAIDVVLVPGVVFDRRGGRLGQGKGYYDKLLAELRPDCLKIGLAFNCQLVENVPATDHDVRMDLVVTETDANHAACD